MADDTKVISVALIEDVRQVREGLAMLVDGTPGFHCAGAYRTMEDALAKIGADPPDVVVTDLAMSGRDGRWLVDQVHTSARPIPVIAVTGYDQDYDLSRAPFARVLTKPVVPENLVRDILDVLARKSR